MKYPPPGFLWAIVSDGSRWVHPVGIRTITTTPNSSPFYIRNTLQTSKGDIPVAYCNLLEKLVVDWLEWMVDVSVVLSKHDSTCMIGYDLLIVIISDDVGLIMRGRKVAFIPMRLERAGFFITN